MNKQSLCLISAALLAGAALSSAAPADTATPTPTGKEDAPKKRQRVVSDLSGFELLDASKLKDKPMVTGATRSFSPKPPVLLAPHLGKLHGASPVFAWKHEGKSFAFALTDASGKEVHAAQVDGTTYAWPASAPHLEDGKTYTWSVKTAAPANAPASSAGVVVVDKAERKQIDKALAAAKGADEYAQGLARAQAFVDKRVWYDAVGVYTDLIAKFPERAEAYEKRGTLFAQIPELQAVADAELEKADGLAKK
jgi:hypothetical protein